MNHKNFSELLTYLSQFTTRFGRLGSRFQRVSIRALSVSFETKVVHVCLKQITLKKRAMLRGACENKLASRSVTSGGGGVAAIDDGSNDIHSRHIIF